MIKQADKNSKPCPSLCQSTMSASSISRRNLGDGLFSLSERVVSFSLRPIDQIIGRSAGTAFLGRFCAILALFIALPSVFASEPLQVDLNAIKQIESSGNPFAFNPRSKATGLYQITPICLKDYNQFNKTSFSALDLFNPEVNQLIATWYLTKRIPQLLKHFGHKDTTQNRLIAYNCGISCLKRNSLPTETKQYLKKYEREANHV